MKSNNAKLHAGTPYIVDSDLDSMSIWGLVKIFLKVSEGYEAIINPSLLKNLHWWILKKYKILPGLREKKIAELRVCRRVIVEELAERYAGVSHQIFTRMNPEAKFVSFHKQIWRKVQANALTLKDYRLFSPTLWLLHFSTSSKDFHLSYGPETSRYKRKFMLRQFVDEMPEIEERTALRLLAYLGKLGSLTAIDRNALRLLERSYPLLYKQLLAAARRGDLGILTGSVFVPEDVYKLKHPYSEFHEWLFK
jgi:hypothetical protein